MTILRSRILSTLPWLGLAALLLLPMPALMADDEEVSVDTAAEEVIDDESEKAAEDPELAAMRAEVKRLRLEQEVRDARLQASLAALKEESLRLEAELAVAAQRRRASIAALAEERERLEAEGGVQAARLQAALREQRQGQERKAQELREQELALQAAGLETRRLQTMSEQVQAANDVERSRRQGALSDVRFELAQMELKLESFASANKANAIIVAPQERSREPFVDGVLTISDRRIDINEPIIAGTGKWFARRIHYFNSESTEYPIFVVIDYCPGGSMMDGEMMLRAMASSKAPVHVVVKSMAASMAAILVSEAPHSYALPNALILHHQPWSYTMGNIAQQQEWLKMIRQWAERLHGPTAERMGMTLEAFYARMYEESVTGDWTEFADKAQALGWVQHIASEIRETDLRVRPDDEAPYMRRSMFWSASAEKDSERIRLPRPRAFDSYFIFNRDGRFFVGE